MFSGLITELENLQSKINKVKAVNVNNSAVKSIAIDLGKNYFATYHPQVLLVNSDLASTFAADWQKLISLAHGNNSKKSYLQLIRALKRRAAEVNIQSLSAPQAPTSTQSSQFTETELALLATLDKMLPTAGLSYRQAVADLDPLVTRQSYRGAAAEFREVLREVLDHLAPDGSIKSQTWYKQEAGRSGPTMKQKVTFVLKSRDFGDTKRKPTEKSAELIEVLFGDITRACYDRASLSVHLQTTRSEVSRMRQFVFLVLSELLELK